MVDVEQVISEALIEVSKLLHEYRVNFIIVPHRSIIIESKDPKYRRYKVYLSSEQEHMWEAVRKCGGYVHIIVIPVIPQGDEES